MQAKLGTCQLAGNQRHTSRGIWSCWFALARHLTQDGRAVLSAECADSEHDVRKCPFSIKKMNPSLGPGIAQANGRDSAPPISAGIER